MARKIGQIIRRGPSTWLVRIYAGRDPETQKRKYIGKSIHGGLRDAQAHLNSMLADRNFGRNIRPRGKPSASASITASTALTDRGSGQRCRVAKDSC